MIWYDDDYDNDELLILIIIIIFVCSPTDGHHSSAYNPLSLLSFLSLRLCKGHSGLFDLDLVLIWRFYLTCGSCSSLLRSGVVWIFYDPAQCIWCYVVWCLLTGASSLMRCCLFLFVCCIFFMLAKLHMRSFKFLVCNI